VPSAIPGAASVDRLRTFFGELKRRNVVRVAGVYAVTTWALFQIANTLWGVFDLPKWSLKVLALVLILGLPVAMIIAWAFELHPEGVRRTQASDRPPPKFRILDASLIAATVAIVGIFALQATGVWRLPWSKGAEAPAAAAAAEKSIAVLPFANFSSSKDAEYFADGLTEEVINSLAKTPDLKVAGRTSAFYYKDKNADLRQVGRQLGVAHVLEGSIRREGERIRVTAQLIKVSDGFHMWSETYDRDVKDAFAVQTEIADNVAGVLKTKLLTQPEAAGDADAYRLVVTARGRMRDLGKANLQAAREAFSRAIKLEPNNADAHAGLAQATMLLAQNYMAINFSDARREAEAEIQRALSIDPKSVSANVAAGFLNGVLSRRIGDNRFSVAAETAFKRAVQGAPNNPDVLTYYGAFLSNEARPNEAVPVLKRALEVDPLNRVTLLAIGAAYGGSGKIDDAAQTYRSVIALYPDFIDGYEDLGSLLVSWGRLDEAEPWLRRAARSTADPSAAVELAHLYFNLGMIDDANAVLANVHEPPMAVGLMRAIMLVRARNYDGLRAFTEAQYARDHDPFWPSAILVAALQQGDDRAAIEQVRIIAPDLLGPDPQITNEFDVPLGAAHALNRLGLKDQAKRILERVLAATADKEGLVRPPVFLVRRAKAHAELGDRARALAELRQAVTQGYRSVVDFEDFVRMEDSLAFRSLRDDPQFKAIVARIDADNARMRQRVLASRNGGQRT